MNVCCFAAAQVKKAIEMAVKLGGRVYVYDPTERDGVAFEDLPDDWRCPKCKHKKEKFKAL